MILIRRCEPTPFLGYTHCITIRKSKHTLNPLPGLLIGMVDLGLLSLSQPLKQTQ